MFTFEIATKFCFIFFFVCLKINNSFNFILIMPHGKNGNKITIEKFLSKMSL